MLRGSNRLLVVNYQVLFVDWKKSLQFLVFSSLCSVARVGNKYNVFDRDLMSTGQVDLPAAKICWLIRIEGRDARLNLHRGVNYSTAGADRSI